MPATRLPFGKAKQVRDLLAADAAGQVVSLLAQSRQLTRGTGRYTVRCSCPNPLHKGGAEKTPSFYFSETEGRFYCFGCNVSGDSFDLISLLGGDGDAALGALQDGRDWSQLPTKPDIRPLLHRNLTEITRDIRLHLEKNIGTPRFQSELKWTDAVYLRLDAATDDLEKMTAIEIRGFFIQLDMDLERRR